MKTHILFVTLTALFLTACASHEGRSISSTQEQRQHEQVIYNQGEASGARDIGPQ